MSQKVYVGGYQIVNMEMADISNPIKVDGLYALIRKIDKPILINNFMIKTKFYKPVYVMFNLDTDGSYYGNAILTEAGKKSIITFKVLDDDTFSASIEELASGGGTGGTTYTEGTGITITDDVINTKIDSNLHDPGMFQMFAELNAVSDDQTVDITAYWTDFIDTVNNYRQLVVQGLTITVNGVLTGIQCYVSTVEYENHIITGVGFSVEGHPYGITMLWEETGKTLHFYIKDLLADSGSSTNMSLPVSDIFAEESVYNGYVMDLSDIDYQSILDSIKTPFVAAGGGILSYINVNDEDIVYNVFTTILHEIDVAKQEQFTLFGSGMSDANNCFFFKINCSYFTKKITFTVLKTTSEVVPDINA